ncbi:MAG: branched-chain amino acid ABC transporter substrate-binding protein [Anaerolineaceae bacterium]|nr:branched-chain amino acid ABC transporter substrate-binding protein [Anaerolineaceae bacterium]MCY3906787.1 branched-chain amino acid ABC transporter substrate-binding protein [Anaerolineaceae bacterium]
MSRFLFHVIALLVLGAMAAGSALAQGQGCEDAIGCVTMGPDDPVTIAWMQTVSGPTSFFGDDAVGGIEIAMEQRDYTVLGREIELIGEDSLCNPEGGQTATQRLVSDPQVVAIIGPSCSSAAVPAIPIASNAGFLMLSPMTTSSALTNPDRDSGGVWMPGFFRTVYNNLLEGAVAAQFAYEELGARTMATIHDGSNYAFDLVLATERNFTEFGGEITFSGAVNVGDTDMTAILTNIASNAPDVLFFPIFQPEGDYLVAQAKFIPGFEDVIMLTADALLVEGFPIDSGESALGVMLTGPAVTGEPYEAFLELWFDKYGEAPPSGFHAHAFDAANMLLDALEAIAVTDEDGTTLVGRQALRDYFANYRDFEGLTGTLSCSPTGDCGAVESMVIFVITEAEVYEGKWPPTILWKPGSENTG